MKKLTLLLSGLLIASNVWADLEGNITKAHKEYAKKDQGYKSSYLPRPGKTRGDDYRNCIDQKYYRSEDPHDFCSWHAGIGKYNN